jgi:hypothetical protein
MKFALHCSRLGFKCVELLTTGGLCLPLEGEPVEWLRAVRRSEAPFDEWWARTFELDADLEGLVTDGRYRPGAVGRRATRGASAPRSRSPDRTLYDLCLDEVDG